MLLMDSIINTAELAIRQGLDDNSTIAIYVDLARKLQGRASGKQQPDLSSLPPPRFVFDQKAILTATELTLGRPKVLREVLRHLRVPYPRIWIEWEDAGREILRQKLSQNPALNEFRPIPDRMGFLVEANTENYRKGKITWAWQFRNHPGQPQLGNMPVTPNVSGITAHFDLDGDFPIDHFEKNPLSLAELWQDNREQLESLYSIWKTVYHEANEAAIAPLARNAFAKDLLFADVVGEYIMVWVCLILLTARTNKDAKPPIQIESVDLSRLNKARAKAKKTLLLDHQIVHLYIDKTNRPGSPGQPLDFHRKSPRIHLVSSYIGRRGDHYWIVFPYMRGSGTPTTRTTHVHG